MLSFWKTLSLRAKTAASFQPEGKREEPPDELCSSLDETIIRLRARFDNSSDLIVHELQVGGQRIALVACEGMVNLQVTAAGIVNPLVGIKETFSSPQELRQHMREKMCLSLDQKEIGLISEVFLFIMSGFVVILFDGLASGISLGVQGFNFRSISEPSSEVNVRGSREGFVEVLRINMTMIRRRIKSPELTFEMLQVGTKSRTDVCLVYLNQTVSRDILRELKVRLKKIRLDLVLESGYLQPFLEKRSFSLFPSVGTTERPDTVAAKINEGRIAVLVDGTPFALIVPYLFLENFQSVDDYCQSPVYVSLTRILRFLAFAFTILLPGLYVAVVTFHPELFPPSLLYNIASIGDSTPFPLMVEAIFIHLVYELMMEAGLRLPRPIGHAMSIVGALVIGDAIVRAGLVGSPMVTVVALTAIASFVIPSLYGAITILRFLFILLGGFFGLYGVVAGVFCLAVLLCALDSFGVPYLAPLTPFRAADMRDVLIRESWRKLSQRTINVDSLPGAAREKG